MVAGIWTGVGFTN